MTERNGRESGKKPTGERKETDEERREADGRAEGNRRESGRKRTRSGGKPTGMRKETDGRAERSRRECGRKRMRSGREKDASEISDCPCRADRWEKT
ncbi:MAG: hypothetical protein NC541_00955 [bacterium]|nr:hypothetical protein [bacterium]